MKNIRVADLMTRSPETVKPDANLLECARKLVKKKIGSLLVVDKKRLKGIILRRDILWALIKKSQKDLSKISAIDISPRKIATIKPSATLEEVLGKMKKFKFQRLPVISDGELVGVITVKDILNFNPEFYPELKELEKIREESEKLKRFKKAKERVDIEGICEECGQRDFLIRSNGMLLCESCKNSM